MAQQNVTSLPTKLAGSPVAPAAPAEKSVAVQAPASEKKAPETKAVKAPKAKKTTVKSKSVAPKSAVKKVKKATVKTAAKKAGVKKAASAQTASAQKSGSTNSSASYTKGADAFLSSLYSLNPNIPMEKVMVQSKTQFDKLAQDASNASRENVEAVVKCTTTFAKGFEEIMRVSMSMAQDAAERQGRFMKDVLSVKTLNEFTEVQNRIAQSNFEDFMSGATKLTEMSIKVLNDSIDPLNEQLNSTIKKATQKAAA